MMLGARWAWAGLAVATFAFVGVVSCVGDSSSTGDTGDSGTNDTGTNAQDGAQSDGGTDAAQVDAATDAADAASPLCDVDKPFAAPTLITEISTSGTEQGFRLSSDYKTAFFGSNRDDADGGAGIWTASRSDLKSPFMSISKLTTVSLPNSGDPSITGDGLTLFFGASTSGLPSDIYVAARSTTAAQFLNPAPTAGVNSSAEDEQPFIREDGQVLYLVSAKSGTLGLYRATATASGFNTPTEISELTTASGETNPVVTPDDLVIYYSSNRTDGNAVGGLDVWVATRASAGATAFGVPRNVAELNTTNDDKVTFVTRDRCSVYFQRNVTVAGVTTRSVYVATKTPN
jgi:hypothetical protein